MRAWAMPGTALVLLLVIVWFCAPSNKPRRIVLSDGTEITILQASFGTNHILSFEPTWKEIARRILPKKLQQPLGTATASSLRSDYDSLVLWIPIPTNNNSGTVSFEAKLKNGTYAPASVGAGRMVGNRGAFWCVNFTSYQRQSREIPLKLRLGSDEVEFTVPNRAITPASKWQAQALPQTKVLQDRKVTLNGAPSGITPGEWSVAPLIGGSVRYSSAENLRAGWTWWHITAFDVYANFMESPRLHGSAKYFTNYLSDEGPWRLLIKGEEYISAGRVPYPTNNFFMLLPLDDRLRHLGIEFFMVCGAGQYEISNCIPQIYNPSTRAPFRRPFSNFVMETRGTNWTMDIAPSGPEILLLVNNAVWQSNPTARFRERDSANSGRTFRPFSWSTTSQLTGKTLIALNSELPTNAAPLEVEIISRFETDFFVDPPATQNTVFKTNSNSVLPEN